MTVDSPSVLRMTRLIRAERQAVWDAWTMPEHMRHTAVGTYREIEAGAPAQVCLGLGGGGESNGRDCRDRRVQGSSRHGHGRAYETGRPFGTSRTAQRPEFVSLKKTCPLCGCAPHTMVALGV